MKNTFLFNIKFFISPFTATCNLVMINRFYTWKSLLHALKFDSIYQIYFSRKILGLTSSRAERVSPIRYTNTHMNTTHTYKHSWPYRSTVREMLSTHWLIRKKALQWVIVQCRSHQQLGLCTWAIQWLAMDPGSPQLPPAQALTCTWKQVSQLSLRPYGLARIWPGHPGGQLLQGCYPQRYAYLAPWPLHLLAGRFGLIVTRDCTLTYIPSLTPVSGSTDTWTPVTHGLTAVAGSQTSIDTHAHRKGSLSPRKVVRNGI